MNGTEAVVWVAVVVIYCVIAYIFGRGDKMRGKTARKLRKHALDQAQVLVPDLYLNEQGRPALFGKVFLVPTAGERQRDTLERRAYLPQHEQGTIRCHPASLRGIYRKLKHAPTVL